MFVKGGLELNALGEQEEISTLVGAQASPHLYEPWELFNYQTHSCFLPKVKEF